MSQSAPSTDATDRTWTIHRKKAIAVDPTPIADEESHGVNLAGYEHAVISVKPLGDSNPHVAVYYWNGEAFVPPVAKLPVTTGQGAGVPYQIVVPNVLGRTMFVAIRAGTDLGDGAAIEVAGWTQTVRHH